MLTELDRAYATIGRLSAELEQMKVQRDNAIAAQVDMARAVRESYPDVFKDDEDAETTTESQRSDNSSGAESGV